MKHYGLNATIALALLWAGTAMADDTQAYLYAIRTRDVAAYYNVKDADKRTMCLAEVKPERTLCYSIVQPSLRNECMVRVKK